MSTDQPEFAPLVEEALRWERMRDSDPYDRSARENLAELLFRLFKDEHPVGTIPRGQRIVLLMSGSFPTPTMVAWYFENLERLLEGRPRLPSPGQAILGLGSGRCGSTSLTAMLAAIEGSCATHENPPLIYWKPENAQLDFHMRRFRLLAEFFPLVFDASHWWLWAIDRFFTEFPNGRAIGLHRDAETCAQSFMRVKGQGRGSFNHWVAPGNGIWCTNYWDPTYPTYPLPENADADPDAAKAQLIVRYVEEYNNALFALRERLPEKVMLIRTEELALPTVQEKMFDFIGRRGSVPPLVLNAGTVDDGARTFRL
jgi:hypothetical protein